MQEELSDKVKISMIVVIALIVTSLAVLVYFYQTQIFNVSADTVYRVPSKLCISGKMKINGKYVADKCIYDIDKTKIDDSNDIAFQIDENYTITYTMGDFINSKEDNSYQAPYQKCVTENNIDDKGWIYSPADFDTSLSTTLGVAIDEPVFDPVLFLSSSSLSGHIGLSEVDYTNVPKSKNGDVTNFKYLKKYDLTVSGAESIKPRDYDFIFDKSISCKDNIGDGNIIYYGGAHQPGDFISLSFKPNITKAEGNILGYSKNEWSLTPNLNGNLIKTKYKIVTDLDDYNYESREIINNLDSFDNTNDENNALDQESQSWSNFVSDISSGSVLWFNLLIAFLIIVVIWYFMYRKKLMK